MASQNRGAQPAWEPREEKDGSERVRFSITEPAGGKRKAVEASASAGQEGLRVAGALAGLSQPQDPGPDRKQVA